MRLVYNRFYSVIIRILQPILLGLKVILLSILHRKFLLFNKHLNKSRIQKVLLNWLKFIIRTKSVNDWTILSTQFCFRNSRVESHPSFWSGKPLDRKTFHRKPFHQKPLDRKTFRIRSICLVLVEIRSKIGCSNTFDQKSSTLSEIKRFR